MNSCPSTSQIREPSPRASALSGGNQQKVILAKSLARNVGVLLLDEPTQGVDVAAKAQIHALIRDFARRDGAVLISSSDLAELTRICDGICALHRGRMTAREIEAARRAVSRYVKRGGQIWLRVFPDVPVTQKPLEVRMGSGKGNVEYWVARVQPGKVLFEMEGVSEDIAREAFRLASAKLSVSTMFVKRQVR